MSVDIVFDRSSRRGVGAVSEHRVEASVDPDGEHRRKRYDHNVIAREQSQNTGWRRSVHIKQTAPRPAWMDDPSLLPKRPPGARP